MAERVAMTCVTVVAESLLEQRLVDDLRRCGALGWTITPARGAGSAHRMVSEFEGGNVRIEVLASRDVVERIWQLLESDYFTHYSVVAWASEVEVLRGDHFVQ